MSERIIYSPMEPVMMFAEIKVEAERLSKLTPEQMNQCVGADQFDMRSWFAGHVAAMTAIVDRYQTSVATVDMTDGVRDQLKDAVLGREFYNQLAGRILATVESTLVLAGAHDKEKWPAIKGLITRNIYDVQEYLKSLWESQWWELIKPRVEAINYVATLETAECVGPMDKSEVFEEVSNLIGTHMNAVSFGTAEGFKRLVALAVTDALEICGICRLPDRQ